MIHIHATGNLVRDPDQKTSKKGNTYTTALLLVASKDSEQIITLMAFDSDLQALLASLKKGDSVSVMGSVTFRAYTDKEGAPQAGVSVIANRIMAMAEGKAKSKPKAPGNGQQQYRQTEEFLSAGPRDFAPPELNDEIPF